MSEHDAVEYLWGRHHAVLYRIELSILYHRKREAGSENVFSLSGIAQ